MNGYGKVARADPCVMELVSRLAREPWTDRPACVHPVLSAVARAVHDHSSLSGRRELLPLAPRFIDTSRAGFEYSARLVALCVSTALTVGEVRPDERRRIRAAHETALHLLGAQDRPGGVARWWLPALGRWGEPFYRTFVAPEHAAEAVAVTARAANGEVRVRALLKQCLAQGAVRPRPSCSASAQKSGS
ncbi:hypothetical protein GCM10009804_14600 [Kribbella hippodromi]|uniref:Uncharacterized protein n=1 Tax=Kribbella hippodromi TaxID=434347 RepID=A0ABN2CHV4_9ACTN